MDEYEMGLVCDALKQIKYSKNDYIIKQVRYTYFK
jgi:hypothetical protein